MEAAEWVSAHRDLVAEAYRRRMATDAWPTLRELKRWIVQTGLDEDVAAAAREMPEERAVNARWVAEPEYFRVPLFVLQHLTEASEIVPLCVGLTKIAFARYSSAAAEIEPISSGDEDVRALSSDIEAILLAGSLLTNEPYTPIFGPNTNAEGWWFNVNDSWIEGYRDIETVADLFARQARFVEKHRAVVAAPLVPSLASVDLDLDDSEEGAHVADPKAVWVVFGRNEKLRRGMFDFLRAIGLKPMEWDHARDLSGSASPYVGQVLDAAFGNAQAVVVLLTPDEVAYLQPAYGDDDEPDVHPMPQARPNVLFEAGMAMGWDSDRTVLVEIGTMRPFSDVAGRHTVRLGTDGIKFRKAIAQRLQTAKCDVDLKGDDWMSTGEFEIPAAPGHGLALGRRLPAASAARPTVSFDIKHFNPGGNKLDRLQVINRGTETAYDVTLAVPEDAALSLDRVEPIEKIPSGKSVTVHGFSNLRTMGSSGKASFDITVTARNESGESVSQDVFIDLNG
jgi:predicted nucleotide-binding protein